MRIFIIAFIGACLARSAIYHNAMSNMWRSLQNQFNYNNNNDEQFPPFDPTTIEGFEQMTPLEQAEIKQTYIEFQKLAQIMEDWTQEFEQDMEQIQRQYSRRYLQDQQEPLWKEYDTGYHGGNVHRPDDPISVDGSQMYTVHHESYMPAGHYQYSLGPAWYEDKHVSPELINTAMPKNPPIDHIPANEKEIDLTGFIVDA